VHGGALDLTRLALEAAFLLLVATAAGFAGLGAGWIVLAVAGAWSLVALVEWRLDRRRPPRPPELPPR
jgi:hypothetical protein